MNGGWNDGMQRRVGRQRFWGRPALHLLCVVARERGGVAGSDGSPWPLGPSDPVWVALAGEEPAAPLYRGSSPLGACLRHSQRPASCPRPSPGHACHQRSWPWRPDPRQPGFPSSSSPGRRALAAWPPYAAPARSPCLPLSCCLGKHTPLFLALMFPDHLLATAHVYRVQL